MTLVRIALDPTTGHPVCHIPSKGIHDHLLGLLRLAGAIGMNEQVEFVFELGPTRASVEALLLLWETEATALETEAKRAEGNQALESVRPAVSAWRLRKCIDELRALMPNGVDVVPAGERL